MDVITCAPTRAVGTALDSLPAGVRVFGVPDPALPFERVEHLLWRAYRTVWPNKRLAFHGALPAGQRELRIEAGDDRNR